MGFQRDMRSDIGADMSVAPQVVTAGTITGATIDTRNFDSGAFIVSVGAIVAAGLATVTFQEGDASDNSDMATIAAADLEFAFGLTAIAALVASTIQRIGYKGNKRYIRAIVAYVSGTSIAISINVVKGHARVKPVP